MLIFNKSISNKNEHLISSPNKNVFELDKVAEGIGDIVTMDKGSKVMSLFEKPTINIKSKTALNNFLFRGHDSAEEDVKNNSK